MIACLDTVQEDIVLWCKFRTNHQNVYLISNSLVVAFAVRRKTVDLAKAYSCKPTVMAKGDK